MYRPQTYWRSGVLRDRIASLDALDAAVEAAAPHPQDQAPTTASLALPSSTGVPRPPVGVLHPINVQPLSQYRVKGGTTARRPTASAASASAFAASSPSTRAADDAWTDNPNGSPDLPTGLGPTLPPQDLRPAVAGGDGLLNAQTPPGRRVAGPTTSQPAPRAPPSPPHPQPDDPLASTPKACLIQSNCVPLIPQGLHRPSPRVVSESRDPRPTGPPW